MQKLGLVNLGYDDPTPYWAEILAFLQKTPDDGVDRVSITLRGGRGVYTRNHVLHPGSLSHAAHHIANFIIQGARITPMRPSGA